MFKDSLDDEVIAERDECQRDAVEEEEEAEAKSLGLDIIGSKTTTIAFSCTRIIFYFILYLPCCHGLGSRMSKNPKCLLECNAQTQSTA